MRVACTPAEWPRKLHAAFLPTPCIPLFTYRSPLRQRGLLVVGVGAALIFVAIPFFVLSLLGAGFGGRSVLAAMCGPLLVTATGAALVALGGTGLFVSLWGPTSLDDDEGLGDAPIWCRCPRCGHKNARDATACAQCGRRL